MDNSILMDVREYIGFDKNNDSFGPQVITELNNALFDNGQLGGGPAVFYVGDATTTWGDYLGNRVDLFASVKAFVSKKTKLTFDPPTSSALLQQLKDEIAELEARIIYVTNIKPWE